MEKSTPLLLLPHQIYEEATNFDNIILWEHPRYFLKYKFNKKKLLLHRASMQEFYKKLVKSGKKVEYLTYKDYGPPANSYIMFDPIDKINGLKPRKILESPNFLLTRKQLEEYRDSTKVFFFNTFYMHVKDIIDIIPDIKSQDKYNRNPAPKNGLDTPVAFARSPKTNAIKEAREYLSGNFSKNYGNFDNFKFPITHSDARREFRHFLQNKLKQFGPYQDAIDKNNFTLFHSLLSSSINIGLIHPRYIIRELRKVKSKFTGKLLPSYEGYIRQLIWREYQRYCYMYFNFKLNKPYFKNNRRITSAWYTGNVGIPPVDDAIKSAFDTGYLHHILRLMVVGNFMNLSRIVPSDGFRWFMEFSCDSYEWVMYQNVYEMVFFVRGETMRRPYLSSSNYILKMSNYSHGDWCDHWDYLYRKFIIDNEKKMYPFRWAYRIYPRWHKDIENYEKKYK